MPRRSTRRTVVQWTLNLVFLGWVLYFTATGRLVPRELANIGGGPHAPHTPHPVVAPADQGLPFDPLTSPDIDQS